MVTRQSDGVPSYKSKHTVVFLCTSIPDYIEPPNLLPYLPDLNPLGCSSAAGISSEDDGRPSEIPPAVQLLSVILSLWMDTLSVIYINSVTSAWCKLYFCQDLHFALKKLPV